MDYEKKKQFINKFKPIGKHIKVKYPNCNLWGVNDIFMFMGFDYRHYTFKEECRVNKIGCNDVRNQNSINFEKDFLGLEMTKSDYDFYKSLNNDTLKTVCNSIFKGV